jgi:hypothetical protein
MAVNRRLAGALVALSSVGAINVGLATPVAAAIEGAISPSEGRPGDRVTLQTGDAATPNSGPVGQTKTVFLISASDLDRQIAKFGHQVCGTSGQHDLGFFTWKGSVGTLTFRIPDVPSGQYFFQVQVRNVSPDCWSIGKTADGPLILMVIGSAATTPGSSSPNGPAPLDPLLEVLLLGALVILTAVTARITRPRQGGPARLGTSR